MMFSRALKSFWVGIRRRWLSGLTQALSAAGGIWLITEITTKVSDTAEHWIKEHSNYYITLVLAVSAVRFFWHVYEVRSVAFSLPTTNTRIAIRYGDLFEQPTDWLIGVGEFFDSEVGQVVSQNSLHGKLINTTYGGDALLFRALVDNALTGAKGTPTLRSIAPKTRYDIGTTAMLARSPHKVFLVAMAYTDLVTSKASSDVPTLWNALRGALTTIRNHGNGAPLSLPLIGNGQSSVNIAPQHLLRLIVLALVDFGRRTGLPKEVNIIVPEDCFETLDIREIRWDWRKR